MPIKKYTKKQIENFKKLYPVTNSRDLAKQMGISYTALKSLAKNHKVVKHPGYRMKPKNSTWNKERDDYMIKHYADTPNPELAKHFNTSVSAVKNRSIKLGLKKSPEYILRERPGQFKKGSVSWNKGISYTAPGSEKGWFKKGGLPSGTLYDGAIRVRKDKRGVPYKFIRASKSKWIPYQRYVWENKHGSIPKDHLICFKDGDTMNCGIDNLDLITKKENALRNSGTLNLTDNYVASMLARKGKKVIPEIKKEVLKHPDLISAHKLNIKLNRKIKEHG